MIHALLVLAVILFIIWLLFHAAGALIHLLWIAIVAALVLWVIGAFFRGGRRLLGR
jgi:multisubunit Na+/H+ antiporter MnhE subunit